MMTRPDNQLPAAGSRRPAQRQWLFPLLCLLVPALAAVALWAWQRGRAPQRSPHRSLPPLALTGDARRDRLAILERAADLLLPPGSTSAPAGQAKESSVTSDAMRFSEASPVQRLRRAQDRNTSGTDGPLGALRAPRSPSVLPDPSGAGRFATGGPKPPS